MNSSERREQLIPISQLTDLCSVVSRYREPKALNQLLMDEQYVYIATSGPVSPSLGIIAYICMYYEEVSELLNRCKVRAQLSQLSCMLKRSSYS
jgi:hypothetical protein